MRSSVHRAPRKKRVAKFISSSVSTICGPGPRQALWSSLLAAPLAATRRIGRLPGARSLPCSLAGCGVGLSVLSPRLHKSKCRRSRQLRRLREVRTTSLSRRLRRPNLVLAVISRAGMCRGALVRRGHPPRLRGGVSLWPRIPLQSWMWATLRLLVDLGVHGFAGVLSFGDGADDVHSPRPTPWWTQLQLACCRTSGGIAGGSCRGSRGQCHGFCRRRP